VEQWRARRANAYSADFEDRRKTLNIDLRLLDEIFVEVDAVLCGATRAVLDHVYPPLVDGYRVLLIPALRGLPALRVAFRIDEEDNERVVYENIDIRRPDRA